jgi:hypothetical protein
MRRMLEDYNELVGVDIMPQKDHTFIRNYPGNCCNLSLSCLQNRGERETARGRRDSNAGEGSWNRAR